MLRSLLILLTVLLVCHHPATAAQDTSPVKTPDSLALCKTYLEQAWSAGQTDTARANDYLQKANAVLHQLQGAPKRLKGYLVFARHYMNVRSYELSLRYTDSALVMARQTADQKAFATIGYYRGCVFLSQGDTKKALEFLMQARSLANKLQDTDLEAHVLSSLGVIYMNRNQLDSAQTYFQKAIDYFEADTANEAYTMVSLQNLGGIFLAGKHYEQGQSALQKALAISQKRQDRNAELTILYNIANGYQRAGRLQEAETYAQTLIGEADTQGYLLQKLYGMVLLSAIRLDAKAYEAAAVKAEEALALSKKERIAPLVLSLYDILIQCHTQMKDYKQALEYEQRRVLYNDSLSAVENANDLEEIKQKYGLQQKNQELLLKTELIEQIKKSDWQKTIIIIFLLVLMLSIVLSLFFYLQRKKIKEELLRKNMALENQTRHLEAFITGQEQERKRIASDLHDGLGQHLVMLKMSLARLSVPDAEQQKTVSDYSRELDFMIDETRRISHNMMPGVLVDLGLQKALRSLTSEMNTLHPSLHTMLSISESLPPLPPALEIQAYRIIQELLNNVVKHAKASTCEVALSHENNALQIKVSDNGTGFDDTQVKDGIGLQNIHSRVVSIHGSIRINSRLQQGTQTHISLPLASDK